jgi:hypothetical protein
VIGIFIDRADQFLQLFLGLLENSRVEGLTRSLRPP